jgi:TonB-linked SusC/RagA family outer membrane protein
MELPVLCKATTKGLLHSHSAPGAACRPFKTGNAGKTFLIMRMLIVLMLATALQVSAKTYSQKVTVSSGDISLEKTFRLFKKQTGYSFLCNQELLEKAEHLNLSIKDLPLKEALDACFAGLPLTYTIKEPEKIVFIEAKAAPHLSPKEVLETIVPPVDVHGTITNEKGEPLAGVSVVIAGKEGGTSTDSKGYFKIEADENDVITLSYVGYESHKFKVKAGNMVMEIKFSMQPVVAEGSDLVIIGVQRQTKRNTTSSISSINGKQIENLPVASPDQLLQGRIPGLNVQVISGEPGIAPTMVIRGNTRVSQNIGGGFASNANNAGFGGPNSGLADQARALSGPLYVIDGVPINTEDIANSIDATGTNYLAGINVNDIEKIDVQKDAVATAAWGSRGANGVVYITTRRGRSKTPEFRVNVYSGVTEQPKLLSTTTGAQERRQKLQLLREYGGPGFVNTLPQMLTDSLNPYFNNATDWQGLFYRNGIIKNADASMSAATDVVNYRLSANYYDEQGVIEAFGFKRYSLRGNFDFKINPKLNSQFIFGISREDRQRGRKYNNSDDNTPVSSFNIPASFYKLTAFDSLNFSGLYDKLRNSNINNLYSASLTLNYDIIKGLRLTSQGSANITTSDRDYFQPSNIDQVQANIGNNQRSYAESDKGTYSSFFLSNTLNYAKSLNAGNNHTHNLVLTGSQQFSRDVFTTSYTAGYDIPSNDIQVVGGVPQQSLFGNSGYGASAILSFLGQLQYDFDKKYILYAGDRADASSRFGKNSKWGYFPSAGVGWVMSDEKFMKGTSNWLSFLKLRASYGRSGQNALDYYAIFNTYQLSGTYNGAPTIQPSYTNGLTKDNLTWSKTEQKNIGIEANFLKNRIYLVADVYDKLTKGDFFDFNLPFFTGYQSISFNANDLWVSNRGVEVSLTTHNLSPHGKLQWTSSLNFAFNKNIIAKLPNNNRTFLVDDPYGVTRIYSVGHPIYQMFQMQYQGVYNNLNQIPFNPLTGNRLTYFKTYHNVRPGDPIWKDQNGDYDVWSDEDNGDAFADRIPTGNPNPLITGGFVNDFSYKNFSLTIISVFSLKRDIINTFYQNQFASVFNFPSSYGSLVDFASRRLPSLDGLNYWVPSAASKDPNGYHANFPALNPYGGNFYQFLPFSTMFNEKGDYFKIKSLVMGYRIEDALIQRLKLKGARVYGIIDNVYTFKRSTVPDPELVDQLGVYTGGAFPIPRKFTLGVEITF